MDSAGERFAAIREELADRKNILTVKELCELAGVSRSGYYNWVCSERARETREQKDRADFERILEAYRFRGYAKGARGIHMRLLHMGVRMNVKKIRRLMRKYRLACPIRKPNPYRRLQRSIRMGSTAENLVNREFESRGPRAVLLTDITYGHGAPHSRQRRQRDQPQGLALVRRRVCLCHRRRAGCHCRDVPH